jgi:hypothetical protein
MTTTNTTTNTEWDYHIDRAKEWLRRASNCDYVETAERDFNMAVWHFRLAGLAHLQDLDNKVKYL